MTTFNFSGPNGQSYTIEGPEGATPQQAFQMLQNHLGAQSAPQQAPNMGAADTAVDAAKSFGTGVGEGLIGLAGLGGDVANLASKGYDYLTGSNTNATVAPYAQTIGSQNIQKKIEGYTGPFYQPKSTVGQYAQTIGQFAPAVVGGPEGLAARALTRAVIPGAASEAAGQLTQGTGLEPYARVAGAVAGAGLPAAVSRVVSPAVYTADRAGAIDRLAGQGVTDMTAGMKTGSKALQYAQNENAAAADAAANVNTLQQLTGSVMRHAGVPDALNAGQATPQILAANRENLSNQFGTLLAKHDAIPLSGFNNDAQKIINEFKAATNSTDAPALQYFIDKVNAGETGGTVPVSAWPKQTQPLVAQLRQQNVPDAEIAKFVGTQVPASTANSISGPAYQSIQSEIGKALRSSYGTPGLTTALGDLKDALDSSVAKGLQATGDTKTFQAVQQLRGQWRDQNILEKAITQSGQYGAEHGVITPSALYNAVNSVSPKRNAVALGSTPLAGLARDAKAVIGNVSPPQSGTAPRLAARVIPAAIAGGVGALIGGPHVGLGAAAATLAPLAASSIYGKMLMNPLAQAYLANQAAASMRQIPAMQNAIKGGVLALPGANAQNQQNQ